MTKRAVYAQSSNNNLSFSKEGSGHHQWFQMPYGIYKKFWIQNLLPASWSHPHRIPPYNNLMHVELKDCIHLKEQLDTRKYMNTFILSKKKGRSEGFQW